MDDRQRRRRRLLESLRHPHPETLRVVQEGLARWFSLGGAADPEEFLDPEVGVDIRWIPGRGWVSDG